MSVLTLNGVMRPRVYRAATVVAMAAMLAACAANPSATASDPEPTVTATESGSAEPTLAASPSATASDAAPPCLPAEIFAAVEDISNVVEPSVPADEIADAVEALDLTGIDHDLVPVMQDDLVTRLRDGDTNSFDLQIAAGVLLQQANLTAC